MGANQTNSFNPLGGGVAGSPIDPGGPGGALIDVVSELGPTAAPDGTIMKASGGAWTLVPDEGRFFVRWFGNAKITGSVTYLRQAHNVIASLLGEGFTADATLKGIAAFVDVAEASNSYDVEVLRDPLDLATPTVLGTLALPSNGTDRFARRRDLSALLAISADDGEYGVRVIRTAGAGNSDFTDIVVLLEFAIGKP